MPFDTYEDYSDDASEEIGSDIDSRDTYGSRFSVTTRRVSNSRNPRPAVTAGQRRLRNSDKIFTKHQKKDNLGGNVNMENINRAKEKKLVENNDDTVKPKAETKKENKVSGLDSLFSSTTEQKKEQSDQKQSNVNSDAESTVKFKPVEKQRDINADKYQAKGHNRKLKIIKPISYNSAKEISSALKADCAVVLSLKTTNDETSKRLLDFAFGAASMCGAKVSVVADKTYALTIGAGLSQREKLLCVKEGIALKIDNSN